MRRTDEHHLVLGGSGFIGSHVVRLLVERGCRVTVADRSTLPPPHMTHWFDKASMRPLDLHAVDWDALVRDVDVVHHYVWTSTPGTGNGSPGQEMDDILRPTVALLDALRRRGGGRVVFSSSGGTVYGPLRTVPATEDHALAPVTAYGVGKATAELYLGLYRRLYGIDCRIGRIANAYGAGQNISTGVGAVTTFLLHAILEQPVSIWGDGAVVRDYVHVRDIAECLVRIATAPAVDEHVFNVGCGVGHSVSQVLGMVESVVGRKLDVRALPGRDFDVPVNVLSIERARRLLGWQPACDLEKGMEMTYRELKSMLAAAQEETAPRRLRRRADR